jgi:hypothetical protein
MNSRAYSTISIGTSLEDVRWAALDTTESRRLAEFYRQRGKR